MKLCFALVDPVLCEMFGYASRNARNLGSSGRFGRSLYALTAEQQSADSILSTLDTREGSNTRQGYFGIRVGSQGEIAIQSQLCGREKGAIEA
jgi:hypothetical protein